MYENKESKRKIYKNYSNYNEKTLERFYIN